MSQLCNFWRQGDLENPATIALLLSLEEIPIIKFPQDPLKKGFEDFLQKFHEMKTI